MLYGQTNALLESCKVSVDKKMLIMKWFQLSLCKHQLVSGVVKSLYQCTMTFPMEIDIFLNFLKVKILFLLLFDLKTIIFPQDDAKLSKF